MTETQQLQQPLPVDLQAEQAFLGACLVDRGPLTRWAQRLKPREFYSTAHQMIWRALRTLWTEGRPADVLTVAAWLNSHRLLDDCGGASYLASLPDVAPTVANADHYAEIVHDCALRRYAAVVAERLRERLYETPDAESLVTYAERLVDDWRGYAGDDTGLKPLTLDSLYAEADKLGEIEWLVPNVVARGYLHIITARPGTGKTWAGLTLAAALAQGIPWANMRAVRQTPVLWIDEEIGARVLAKRLRQLDVPPDAPIYNLSMRRFKVDIPAHIREIRGFISEHNIGLVVLDSLRRIHDKKENDNSDIGLLAEPLRSLCEANAAVVILHHTRKFSIADADAPAMEQAAGAAYIVGMMDMGLSMSRDRDRYTLRATKARLISQDAVPEVGFKLVDNEWGGVDVLPLDPAAEREQAEHEIAARVLRFVRDNPGCTVGEIQCGLSVQRAIVSAASGRLARSGHVRIEPGPHGSKRHYVTEDRLTRSDPF